MVITQALAHQCAHADGVQLCLHQLLTPAVPTVVLDLQSRPQLLGIGEQAVDLAQYDALVGVRMSVETVLLESQLKQLGLTTFVRNHAPFVVAAVQSQFTYADDEGPWPHKKSTSAKRTRASDGLRSKIAGRQTIGGL